MSRGAPPESSSRERGQSLYFRLGLGGRLGALYLIVMLAACLGSLPYTLGEVVTSAPATSAPATHALSTLSPNPAPSAIVPIVTSPRYDLHNPGARRLPPSLSHPFGTDLLGRDLLVRALAGGGVSLTIGLAAALLSVVVGTAYGAIAGMVGGRVDAVMMRIVDVLYGLPYVLLVVLLAVVSDSVLDEHVSRSKARSAWMREHAREVLISEGLPHERPDVARRLETDATLRGELQTRADGEPSLARRRLWPSRGFYQVLTMLLAIGGVSWLTMSRVIRGQVLSLKAQPFMEAARAIGVSRRRQLVRHLLPNLAGPIIVYATLTVPQAILQESFLSFLGIGVRAPLPSWGNLASEGLEELNRYKSHWWLLLFPCLLLGTTLLSLNFVGEGLREALDPRRVARDRR